MNNTHRIYQVNGKFFPQYQYKGDWRYYENCFEHEFWYPTEEQAREHLIQELQKNVDYHKEQVRKAQTLLKLRQSILKAAPSAPLVNYADPVNPYV